MVIGIVSDTHGYYHPELDTAFASVDHIFHAGDIGDLKVIDNLRALAPVTAVWGNIDGTPIRRETKEYESIELDGIKFLMMHIAGKPGRLNETARFHIAEARPDVFICGHSHILQIERLPRHGRPLFINPGAAGRHGLHQVKTCVRLTVRDGTLSGAEVIHLDGD